MKKITLNKKVVQQLLPGLFCALILLGLTTTLNGQSTVTIGTGITTAAGTNGTPIYRSSTTSTFHHSKSIQLITAAQLATAGVTSGSQITGWAYNKQNSGAPAGSNSWTMNVYLKNTSNTVLTSGTSWTTMISGATLGYTATINSSNMPAALGYWNWPITGFVYSGGAIECYIEWVPIAMSTPFTTNTFLWQYTAAGNQAMGTSNSVAIPGTQSAWTTQARFYNTQISFINVPPTVSSYSPSSGCTGSSVTITGANMSGATAVAFNGVNAPGFTLVNGTTITVIVPPTATTGAVTVTTPGGTGTGPTYTVTGTGPTAYAVTGGGVLCTTPLAIGLASSEIGVSYQLLLGVVPVGSPVIGDGNPISFGSFSSIGSYTAEATSGGCVAVMTGSAVISLSAGSPAITVTPASASACSGNSVNFSTTVTNVPAVGYDVASTTFGAIPDPGGSPSPTSGDDAVSAAIALPFSFNFYGVAQSQMFIYTNGFVQFGTSSGNTTTYGATIPTAATPNNIIAVCWEDLNPAAGQITYWTSGSAPNRIFVVNYNAVNYFSATPGVTSQLQLYENNGSNYFQIHITNNTQAGNSTVIGCENSGGTAGTVPPGRNFGVWSPATLNNEAWSFTPTVIPTYSYSWLPTTGLSNPAIASPVLTASTSATYTVSVTNNVSGCITQGLSAITTLGAANAIPVATGNSRCGTGTVVLSATGSPSLDWYAAPTGGTLLGSGTSFTTPSISATTTYYVESFNGTCPSNRVPAVATINPVPTSTPTATPTNICAGGTSQLDAGTFVNGSITTGLLAGNGSSGNAFNVTAAQNIVLHNFSMTATTASPVEVWYIPGGFAGPTLTSNAGWTLAGSGTIAIGTNSPIVGLDANISIPAGATYGIVVVSSGSNSYTNGTTFGNTWATDGILTIKEGCGGTGFGGAFGFSNTPRNFNGTITYAYGDPNLTFVWSPAGSLSSTSIINPVATPTTTTTYSVQSTNLGGCSNNTTVTVTVPTAPVAPTATVISVPCGAGVASLSATGTGGTIKWWSAASGGTALATGGSYSPTVAGNTTFYVSETTIASPFCEGPRAQVDVVVGVSDLIAASADNTLVCGATPGATTVTLSVANINPSPVNTYTYTWTTSAGGVLNSTTGTTVTANPTTSATYTVTALDAGAGCTQVQSIFVGVGYNPLINSVSASQSTFCAGNSTILTASASLNSPLTTGPQTQPTGYCTSNGTSFIDEQIFGVSFGTMNNLSQGETCAADYTDYTGSVPAPTITTGTSVNWSVNQDECDGATYFSNGIAIYIDYNRNGSFLDAGEQVFTTTATAPGPRTLSGSITIPLTAAAGVTRMRVICVEGTASPTPCQAFTYGETEDYIVNIIAQTGNLHYSWTPATGLSSTNVSTVTATPASGTSTYSVTVTDDGGCPSTGSVVLTVNPIPAAPTTNNPTVCGQGTVTMTATSSVGSIFWTDATGGPITASGNNYSKFVNQSGTYYAHEDPGAFNQTVGLSATAAGTTAFASSSANYQSFNVLTSNGIIINSVDIVPSPATPLGTPISIQLENNAGVAIGAPFDAVTTTQGTVQTLNLNMYVPQGNAYRLRPSSNPNLQYHQNGFTNPYTLPGVVSITGWGPPDATTLYVFFYNWSVNASCFSAATASNVTVTTPPTLAITAGAPLSYCSTGNVPLNAATGSDPSYVNFSWLPATGLDVASGASVLATPSATTSYTVTADDGIPSGCASSAAVTITVNAPPTLAIGSVPATLCLGNTATIPAVGGSSSIKQVGAVINTANNTIAVYDNVNVNIKTQILYTQAELNAAGLFGPSNITSIAFEVANKLSSGVLNGFTISMASVGTTSVLTTTYLTPSFTTVFTGNVSTTLGWNTHNFTTAFAWDGVSSVVVQVCNGTPSVAGFDQVYNTPTSVARTIVGNLLGCTSATGATSLNRPNTRFAGGSVTYSWNPGTGLSSTSIANPVFDATAAGPGTSTYTLTVTDPATSCSVEQSVTFNVNNAAPPTASISSPGTTICAGTLLSAVTNAPAATYQWQLAGVDISGATSSTYEPISAGAYSVIVNEAGCNTTSSSSSINTINSLPIATATALTNPGCAGVGLDLSSTGTPTQAPPTGNYTVAAIPYSPVTPTGTPTVLQNAGVNVGTLTGSLDDGTWDNIPLPVGFAFNYYGTTPTAVSISTNGFFTFTGASTLSGCCSGQVLPSATTPNDVIALAWEDWNQTAGTMDYFTNGVAPNRKFVVRAQGVPRFGGTSGASTVMAILNETSNTIELQVTSVTTASGDATTMGIENAAGTLGTTVAGRNSTSPWTATNEAWLFAPPVLGGTTSYSWTGPNGFTSSSQNPTISNPVVANAGTYTVTFTDGNGCVSPPATTDPVVVYAPTTAPSSLVTDVPSVCIGQSATLSQTGGSLGEGAIWVWYSDAGYTIPVGTPISTPDASIAVSPSATTTYYLRSEGGSSPCTPIVPTPTSVTVVVNPTPSVTATPSSTSTCSGTSPSISLSGGATYSWTGTPDAGTAIGSGNAGDPSTGTGSTISELLTNSSNSLAGQVVYSVSTVSAEGCPSTSNTLITVDVNPAPTATVTDANNQVIAGETFCNGGSTDLHLGSSIGGTTFDWSSTLGGNPYSSGSANPINESIPNNGTSDVTVIYTITPTANGCDGAAVTATEVVEAKPVGSNTSVFACSGYSSTINLTTSLGSNTGYTWTSSTSDPITYSNTSGSGSPIQDTYTNTSGNTGVVTYTVSPYSLLGTLGCAGDDYTVAVSVGSIPLSPGAISGPSVVCQVTSTTYSIAAVPNATSYVWTVPGYIVNGIYQGMTITSQNDNGPNPSITVSITSGAMTATGSGDVTVTAINGCVDGLHPANAPATLTVTKKPAVPGAISGLTSVCGVTSTTYSVAPVFGATSYAWTLPSGMTLVGPGTGPSITVNIATTYAYGQVKVSAVNACGNIPGTAKIVYGTPVAPVSITGPLNVCGMSSATYTSAASSGAISYTWVLPAGMTSGGLSTVTTTGTSISVSIVGNVSGALKVRANSPCGSSTYRTITLVTTAPATGAITGLSNICGLTTSTYSIAAVSGAVGYQWTLSSGLTGSSTGTSITVTIGSSVINGTIKVAAINACGIAGAQTNKNLSRYVTPGAMTGSASVCVNTTSTYTITRQSGVTYNWSAVGGTVSAQTLTSTTSSVNVTWDGTAGAGSVKVNGTNTCGQGPDITYAVTKTSCPSPISVDNSSTEPKSPLFNLYPNPTSADFTMDVTSEMDQDLAIEVYDVLGNRVISEQHSVTAGVTSLKTNIESFRNGMYFVRVVDMDSNTLYTQSVIKE